MRIQRDWVWSRRSYKKMVGLFQLIRKLINILYTISIKRCFYSFGKDSRFNYPLKVYNPRHIQIGANVTISEYGWLNSNSDADSVSLIIGKNTFIGRFVHINAYKCVTIEDNVVIGERVYISDATHVHNSNDIPIIQQGTEYEGQVLIKEGTWIGSGVSILPGVIIGRNVVIGANAVVTKNIPDNVTAAGVPAKILKDKSNK